MKTLKKLSKKATEYCKYSGYDVRKVKELIKYNSFAIQKLETKEEIKSANVDFMYPYQIFNPFNFTIK